jgi:hypothetical protein
MALFVKQAAITVPIANVAMALHLKSVTSKFYNLQFYSCDLSMLAVNLNSFFPYVTACKGRHTDDAL